MLNFIGRFFGSLFGDGGKGLSLTVGGQKREYLLYRPKGWQPGGRTVVIFHPLLPGGGGRAAAVVVRESGINRAAGRLGWQAVAPIGLGGNWEFADPTSRDADFVYQLLLQVQAGPAYAIGHSNGGKFAYLLAITRQAWFRAIGVVHGAVPEEANGWPGWGRVPVIEYHNRRDTVLPWEGGRIAPGQVILPIEQVHRRWIEAGGQHELIETDASHFRWPGGATERILRFFGEHR